MTGSMAPLIVALIALTMSARPASAAPITFAFTGTVEEVADEDFLEGFLDGSIMEGTPFAGAYTFDSDTLNASASMKLGDYRHTGSPFGIWVDVGNYRFQSAGLDSILNIRVENDFLNPGNDSYTVRGSGNESIGPPIDPFVDIIGIRWRLFTGSNDPLSSVDLLTVPPPLEPWTVNQFSVFGDNSTRLAPLPLFTIDGAVTSVTVVPEPGTLGLLAGSLVALVIARRRVV